MVKQVAHTATEAQCLRKREDEIVTDGFRGAWTINMDHFKSGLDSQFTIISSCNASLPPRYSMNETSRTQSEVQTQLARSLHMMRSSPAAFRHCGLPRPLIGSHLESTDSLLELSHLPYWLETQSPQHHRASRSTHQPTWQRISVDRPEGLTPLSMAHSFRNVLRHRRTTAACGGHRLSYCYTS